MSKHEQTTDSERYSDLETVPSTDSYSTLEVADPYETVASVACELCLIRPSAGNHEFLACHTRPKFESQLCNACAGDATYFATTQRDSRENCKRCSRQLRHHETDQARGCFLEYKYLAIGKVPPRQTIIPYVNQWPAENTHKRHLR